jgi:hypothetical protein
MIIESNALPPSHSTGGGMGGGVATAVTKGIPAALLVIVIGVFSWLKKRRGSLE